MYCNPTGEKIRKKESSSNTIPRRNLFQKKFVFEGFVECKACMEALFVNKIKTTSK